MEIQWYPGHMLETKKFLTQAVAGVDVVMEIRDARLPVSSANPLMDRLCKGRYRALILNKKDLADPRLTDRWTTWFSTRFTGNVFTVNGTDTTDLWRVLHQIRGDVPSRNDRRTRIMVVGIPNTGKSTIINTLAGKKVAKTGNTPAITRQQQRTGLKHKMDIYDTPGILWPVLDDQDGARRLAASGAISDTAMDYIDVAWFLADFLIKHYPENIIGRYNMPHPLTGDPQGVLDSVGARRGCLKKGGVVDLQKAAEVLIRDFRTGKLGRITLEIPDDAKN